MLKCSDSRRADRAFPNGIPREVEDKAEEKEAARGFFKRIGKIGTALRKAMGGCSSLGPEELAEARARKEAAREAKKKARAEKKAARQKAKEARSKAKAIKAAKKAQEQALKNARKEAMKARKAMKAEMNGRRAVAKVTKKAHNSTASLCVPARMETDRKSSTEDEEKFEKLMREASRNVRLRPLLIERAANMKQISRKEVIKMMSDIERNSNNTDGHVGRSSRSNSITTHRSRSSSFLTRNRRVQLHEMMKKVRSLPDKLDNKLDSPQRSRTTHVYRVGTSPAQASSIKEEREFHLTNASVSNSSTVQVTH
eukprot:CAMPEP_0184490114 /NCGR_PEP_ID=MMETSP0113_2-20130426/17187_1 /TAXON_ID=91329 /ORGANISM="Norrisiella sphaerica, Strain BC52" /LENGTH=311 /DNA_ID=CAMNT_0026873873 /DNA_START=72 /DNA_END=1004 /DNA_ORIENTATION=+